jgi:hypothetical protein
MFGTCVDKCSLEHKREDSGQGITVPHISKLEEHSPEITWLQHPGLLPHTPENVDEVLEAERRKKAFGPSRLDWE